MLQNSSHSWCFTHLATSWQQANYSQIGFASNLTNKPENVFPQPHSCAAKPTQDFFPVPVFHCITSFCCVDAAVCETIQKTNDTQLTKRGLEVVGVGVFLITKYHHSAMSLVGFEHYSDNSCTDTDYVDLMSNPSSSFPNSATGEKSWPTKSEETMRWSSPLLPIQKAPMPRLSIANLQRWIFHNVSHQNRIPY